MARVLIDRLRARRRAPGGDEKLVAFVAEGKPTGPARRRVREAVHAILTMPEYQLA